MTTKVNPFRLPPPKPPVSNIPIIDTNNYDTKIILEIDTITGASRIRIEGKTLTHIQVLGALTTHTAVIANQIAVSEAMNKQSTSVNIKDTGGSPNGE